MSQLLCEGVDIVTHTYYSRVLELRVCAFVINDKDSLE